MQVNKTSIKREKCQKYKGVTDVVFLRCVVLILRNYLYQTEINRHNEKVTELLFTNIYSMFLLND